MCFKLTQSIQAKVVCLDATPRVAQLARHSLPATPAAVALLGLGLFSLGHAGSNKGAGTWDIPAVYVNG